MKRIVSIICLLTLICLTATACGANTTENDTVYDKLNKLMDDSVYNYLTVTVTTEVDADTELTSRYLYTKTDAGLNINYSIENLGQFREIDGVWVAPESMIETYVGGVVVEDGKIVSTSGDTAPFDMSGAALPHFDFKESYFTSVVNEEGHLTAKVLAPGAFMGTYTPCSAMSVDITYHDYTITDILISYVSSDGNSIVTKYEYR